MSSRLTVLSPHRDDAAFSLALTLHEALRAGCSLRVIVCVTRSDYAPLAELPADADLVEAVSALRTREEAAFEARLRRAADLADSGPVEFVTLGCLDAPLRGDYPGLSVMHDRPFDAAEREEVERLRATLAPLSETADALLVPLAVGDHIDHRIARAAAEAAWPTERLVFYEDLPYCCLLDEDRITGHARRVAPGVGPRVLGRSADLAEKFASLRCYPSQVPQGEMIEMLRYARRYGGAERVWAWPGPPLY